MQGGYEAGRETRATESIGRLGLVSRFDIAPRTIALLSLVLNLLLLLGCELWLDPCFFSPDLSLRHTFPELLRWLAFEDHELVHGGTKLHYQIPPVAAKLILDSFRVRCAKFPVLGALSHASRHAELSFHKPHLIIMGITCILDKSQQTFPSQLIIPDFATDLTPQYDVASPDSIGSRAQGLRELISALLADPAHHPMIYR